MKLRPIIFWLHLSAGVVAGLIILVMSVTGVLLSFEPQILRLVEGRAYRVEAIPGAPRLDLDRLVQQVDAAVNGVPAGVTIRRDPADPITVSFGREKTVFISPSTGVVLGEGAKGWRFFFHVVEDFHRWLGLQGENRILGKGITGVCNAAFVVLVLSGVVMWWPKSWSWRTLKGVTCPEIKLRGRARDWNWHNALGFWAAPMLFLISLSGVVISYPWASDVVYRVTGNVPPPRAERASGPSGGERGLTGTFAPPQAGIETLVKTAAAQSPDWISLSLRWTSKPGSPVNVLMEESHAPHPYARSSLTLDPVTGAVIKRELWAEQNSGRKLRTWLRAAHTGEVWGVMGQFVAMLASAAAVVLVWTGLALSWRRFFGRSREKAPC